MNKPEWKQSQSFQDIIYEKWEGVAKVTINRPEVRNAFRPQTVFEMSDAFHDAREDSGIGVIILTGAGDKAFCSGGDQKIRGDSGYKDNKGVMRLNVLDLQRQIRTCPKPVVAMVNGFAIGGGACLACGLRLKHCLRERDLWSNRAQGGFFRRWSGFRLFGQDRRPEKSP